MLSIETPGPDPAFPADQQPLAELPVVAIRAGTRITLPADARACSLSVAADYRGDCRLHARCGDHQLTVDASFAGHNQRLIVELPTAGADLVIESLDGPAVLWVVADNPRFPQAGPAAHAAGEGDLGGLLAALERGCIAQFGWMLGCVSEGCDDLHAATGDRRWAQARDAYLATYLDHHGRLRYQDLHGHPLVDRLRSEETGLPLAAWCRANDAAALRPTIAAQWLAADPDAGEQVTAEGSYCTAYPMLQMAAGLAAADPAAAAALRERGWRMLATRRERLLAGPVLALRERAGRRSFEQWARAWAWYLLGLARSLMIEPRPAFLTHLGECCEIIAGHQRDDGLWSNFVDDHAHRPDTSGSAGIAAALLHAAELGCCPSAEARRCARHCWQGLQPFLRGGAPGATWLTGNAPTNKRGEAFQRGSERTCNAFGMGLAGQLHAGLLRHGADDR